MKQYCMTIQWLCIILYIYIYIYIYIYAKVLLFGLYNNIFFLWWISDNFKIVRWWFAWLNRPYLRRGGRLSKEVRGLQARAVIRLSWWKSLTTSYSISVKFGSSSCKVKDQLRFLLLFQFVIKLELVYLPEGKYWVYPPNGLQAGHCDAPGIMSGLEEFPK